MSAFERILSGFPDIDRLLDNIRLGDNVVWRVKSLDEFRCFAEPFAEQALADGRTVIYMRFAGHEPLLRPRPGLKIREFDPDKGFEAFTVDIYNCITENGREAFYIFDSLSELQSVWYTDLMMGNFFRVTCPYLFCLDTVACFPLLRGRHSFDAVARIRDTTQVFLDVYRGEGLYYIHPLKVWDRYSAKMFLPHAWDPGDGTLRTVEDGVALSRYYRVLEEEEAQEQDQSLDSHDRFFSAARMAFRQGSFSRETERQIVESTMTKDRRLQEMLRRYFEPRDYFLLRDRMAGSGSIGGKACGMLLARKIVRKELPGYESCLEPHDSFYIGSDVFYTYIVSNNCWELRIAQRTKEGYFSRAEELRQALLTGEFPGNIREKFRSILDYFGQSPVIVRSSSFLEDGFGNAFAGKYESVFCVNQGSPAARLQEFEDAALDRPAVSMQTNTADRHRFSQRRMDVLDTEKNAWRTVEADKAAEDMPLWLRRAVMERDHEAEAALRRMGRERQVWFITCQGLLENKEFTDYMRELLRVLERAYGNPVDIEYTVNLDQEGRFVVNLLQCRPLYTGSRNGKVEILPVPEEQVLFSLQDSSVGDSASRRIDVVVQIDPRAYYGYPYGQKYRAAEAVGRINRYYRGQGKSLLLTAPGRIGTSSPELGVPVKFADISGFAGICEVSDSRAGYMPELSYGSHMFQDLVEAGIFYAAVWMDRRTRSYHPELTEKCENVFPAICPDMPELFSMFRVTETAGLYYWNDVMSGKCLCGYRTEGETVS